MEVTFLEQQPLVVHPCRHEGCKTPAKCKIWFDGKPVFNMCLRHTDDLCEKNGIKIPLMSVEQCRKSFTFLNDTFLPLVESCGEDNECKRVLIDAAVKTGGITKEEGDLMMKKFEL